MKKYAQHLILAILFVSTVFNGCKKNDASQSESGSSKLTLAKLIGSAKLAYKKNGGNALNWDIALVTTSLSDTSGYEITFPEDQKDKKLNKATTFKFTNKGQVTSFQNLSLAKNGEYEENFSRSKVLNTFLEFEKGGYLLDESLKTEIKTLGLKSVQSTPKILSQEKRGKLSLSTHNKLEFSANKDIPKIMGTAQSYCESQFNVHYTILYVIPCDEYEIENHKTALREHVYSQFREYFFSNDLNLQIGLEFQRTRITGPTDDMLMISSNLIQQLTQQFISGFIYYGICNVSPPDNISVIDFQSSCQASQPGTSPGTNGNQVIISDPSVLGNPTVLCLLNKLMGSNRGRQKLLGGFINSSTYNVTFKVADILPSNFTDAQGTTVTTPGSNNVDIYLRSGHVSDTPIWGVAKTAMHEMAHAYLAQKLMTIGGASNLAQNLNDTDFETLFDYYTKYVNPATGTLSATANSSFQHAAMASLLIDDIAMGIQDFVEANTPDIKNDTYVTFDNYKALAWIGLRDTEAYQKFKEVTSENDDTQDLKINLIQQGTVNGCN